MSLQNFFPINSYKASFSGSLEVCIASNELNKNIADFQFENCPVDLTKMPTAQD